MFFLSKLYICSSTFIHFQLIFLAWTFSTGQNMNTNMEISNATDIDILNMYDKCSHVSIKTFNMANKHHNLSIVQNH